MCVCPVFHPFSKIKLESFLITLLLLLSHSRDFTLSFCNTCVFNDDDDESLKLSKIFWCKIATSSLRDSRGLEAL